MPGYTWSSNLNEKVEGNTKPKDGDIPNKQYKKSESESADTLPMTMKETTLHGFTSHGIPLYTMQTNNEHVEHMGTVDTSQIVPMVDIV